MKSRNDLWTLIRKDTGEPVAKDDIFTTSRGEEVTVTAGQPPHKPSSTGRVTLTAVGEEHDSFGPQYYPTVIDCEWRKD